MKFLIPSAKEMKFTAQPSSFLSQPAQKYQPIIDTLSVLTSEQLERLYKVNPKMAKTEWQHIQAIKNQTALTYPALDLFNGLMYRHIKRQDLSEKEYSYLKDRAFITSALYGIISVFDHIAPHRLDFNVKLDIKKQPLKSYWRQEYDNFVKKDDKVISLLSSEFEDVFSPKVRAHFLKLKFLEEKNGQLKSHSTISKKARGAFLTQALKKQCQSVNELKEIHFQGFAYEEQLSTKKLLVFVKYSNSQGFL
nr:peroxide stress protein YaaA [Streptococcus macacae]